MQLKDWLISKKLSVPKFCKYHDLCEESIYNYIKGRIPRSNIAVNIVKATGGEVTLEELGLSVERITKIRIREQKLKEKRAKAKAAKLS